MEMAAHPSDFFHLSRDIHISLLSEWIPSGKAYSALDVAVCSHGMREQWLALLRDPMLRVELSFEAAPDNEYYRSWLPLRGLNASVRHLNTDQMPYHRPSEFYSYSKTDRIDTVVLRGTKSSDYIYVGNGYAAWLKCFPNLTKLTSSRWFAGSMGSNSLKELSTLNAQLKVLEIMDTGSESRRTDCPFRLCVFNLVFRFGSTLEVLHLDIIGIQTTLEADGVLMGQIRCRCPLLRVLRLPGIAFHYQDVLGLSESHPHLTALECRVDFSHCPEPKPYDTVYVNIKEKFHDLEIMSVLGHRITADTFPINQYPKLKVFACNEMSVNVSSSDSSSFTINSDTEVDVRTACQFLLNMSASVKTIARSKHSSSDTSIDHATLLAIAHKHGAALERWIDFHYAINMDNATLEQFLMMCPRMKTLDIPRSQRLTYAAVFCVAEHCRNLVALIMGIADVTDDALHALLTRCTKLKKLCLPGRLLTSAVFESCSQLTMLGFTSQQLRFTVNEMIDAITGGKLGKLRVLRLPRSDLLQYVSTVVSMATFGNKLKIEEFQDAKDFV